MSATGGCANQDEVQKKEKTEIYKLYFSIFFDGTGNNKDNIDKYTKVNKRKKRVEKNINEAHTEEKLENLKTEIQELKNELEKLKDKGDSYYSGYSNVAKLWRSWKKPHPNSDKILCKRHYVQGIGTFSEGSDSNRGFALGTGDSGIEERCEKEYKRIESFLDSYSKKSDCENIELTVHLFGFSRGSAAARHFIHIITTKDLSKYKVSKNKIEFVGLFDTVSAHGIIHSNDVGDLKLAKLGLADKVVQYAAADEHRYKFELTDISSAGSKGEIHFLPGVHSDIGGGYTDVTDEYLLLNYSRFSKQKIEKDYEWLIKNGFFLPNQLTIKKVKYGGIKNGYQLFSERKSITNKYSFIAYELMRDSINKENNDYLHIKVNKRYQIPKGELSDVYNKMFELKSSNQLTKSIWKNHLFKFSTFIDLKKLRNKYCHFSSRYTYTHISNESVMLTSPISPHEPNFISNKRERHIYSG